MSKYVQFLPIVTAYLDDDGTILLEQDWDGSVDVGFIEESGSTMTLAEAREVERRVGEWARGESIMVRIPPPEPDIGTAGDAE